MKRRRKLLLVAAIVIVLLLVATERIADYLVVRNLRRWLEQGAVLKGRAGTLTFSLWRSCLVARDVEVSQPQSCGYGQLVKIQKLQACFCLMPLWHRQVYLTKLEISSPELTILALANGENSFSCLRRQFPMSSSPGLNLFIRKLLLSGGRVTLTKVGDGGSKVSLEGLSLSLKDLAWPKSGNKLTSFYFSGRLKRNQVVVPFRFEGRASFPDGSFSYRGRDTLGPVPVAFLKDFMRLPGIQVRAGELISSGWTVAEKRGWKSRRRLKLEDVCLYSGEGISGKGSSRQEPARISWKVESGSLEVDFSFDLVEKR